MCVALLKDRFLLSTVNSVLCVKLHTFVLKLHTIRCLHGFNIYSVFCVSLQCTCKHFLFFYFSGKDAGRFCQLASNSVLWFPTCFNRLFRGPMRGSPLTVSITVWFDNTDAHLNMLVSMHLCLSPCIIWVIF